LGETALAQQLCNEQRADIDPESSSGNQLPSVATGSDEFSMDAIVGSVSFDASALKGRITSGDIPSGARLERSASRV
jgi:hypothetical protein